MTVQITGPTGVNVTVGLTPTSGGCQSQLASTVCAFTYSLAPGSYHATLVTYDAITGCPNACAIPGGANELSTAQLIAFTITPGVANNIPLTLSGVPASLMVFPMTGSIVNATRGIDMFGTAPRKMLVEAFDADGNIIFGAGSPTYSISQSSGSLAVTIGQPTTATPNTFTVTPPSTFSASTATLTINATYTGQPTNGCVNVPACTTTQVFDMKQLFATYSFSRAFVWEDGQTSAFAEITSGISSANAIAFDTTGNLYIAQCFAGCGNGSSPDSISVYAPPYTGTPVYVTNGVSDPQSLKVSNGKLFAGMCGACSLGGTDSVAIYTLPLTSSSSPAASITSGVIDPVALAFDNNNPPNLFVADCASCGPSGTDAVTKYASPYTGSATTLSAASLNGPVALAIDSGNDVFVGNTNGGIGGGFVTAYVAPAYTFASTITAAADTTTFNNPNSLATDIGGTDIIIGDNGNSQVYVCGPAFTTSCGTGSTVASGVNGPNSVAEDGLGNLLVSNTGGNNVTTYAAGAFTGASTVVSTNGNSPFGLAVLP